MVEDSAPRATDDGVVVPTDVDPLQQAIDQHTGPKLAQLDIEIAGATDAATFYPSHPEALKYKDQIEQGFNNLKAQGKAFSRQAVWDWFRGNDKNFNTFVKEAMETEKKKLEDAEHATTVDSSGRPVVDSPKAFFTSSSVLV